MRSFRIPFAFSLPGTSSAAATVALLSLVANACTTGSPGLPGAEGSEGTPGPTPPVLESEPPAIAINAVEPRAGLLARRLDVTVGTSGAIDLSSAELTFGDGVTVERVAVVGNALVATLAIAADAALGKRDVVLTSGGETLTAKDAFVVAVHLDAKVAAGKAEQGGLVRLDITNRDKVAFAPATFTLFPLTPETDPSLVGLKYESFTTTDGSVVFLGDPLAKAGPLGFLGFNDPDDDASPSYVTANDAVTVGAREPLPLTSGTPIEKTLAGELETAFYAFDATPSVNEGLIVDAWARVPAGSTMAPLLVAYPKSGSAADLVDQALNDPGYPAFGIPATEARVAYPVTAATKGYFVVVDSALANGPTTRLSFEYSAVRAQIYAEKAEPHASAATAQNIGSLPGVAATIPGRIINGALKAANETDVYMFTGLSQTNPTDMLVSLVTDSDVVVRVDTVPTFDSDDLVEVVRGGTAGMAATRGFVGKDRFVQVVAAEDGAKKTGKYSLGIKRLPPMPDAPPQP